MNMSALNMLNVTLGMQGISGGDKTVSDSEISFGDVFSQAVNAAAEVSPAQTDAVEETAEDAENVTFAVLTTELKENIAEAGEDVIKAAISILKSVGKAVELLMGTLKSDDADEDNADSDVTSVFGMLLSIMPQKNSEADEVTSEEQAVELIVKIADAIETGAEEELPPLEIVKKVVKAISPKESDDDDREELANALLDILSSITGIDRGETFEFPETEVTEFTVEKLGGILREAVSQKPAEDIARAVEEIINAPEQTEKTEVKFADFLSRPETGRNMTESVPVLHIVNAAAQLNVIRGGENIAPETAENDVYSQLWTITSEQLTDKLAEEISSPMTDGVKELTVVLKPESLGEIAVKLSQDSDGRISVILAASNPEIGRAVSENAYALTASLSKQNVTVSNVNVVEPNQAATFMELDFTGRGFDRRNDESSGNNGSARNSSAVAEIEAADEFRAQKLLKEAKLWATA